MISLANFLVVNHDLILFVYGLVFFVLGFAISLQVRRSSRLDLARSMRWLAAFGITHAFNEWGDLFIPLQAGYLGLSTVSVLLTMHMVLLAASFVCLFEFGVTILNNLGQAKWLRGVSIILFLTWLFAAFVFFLPLSIDHYHWQQTMVALARYFIGFPGGLLAAIGLRVYTLQRIKPLNVPQIVRMLKIAGFSLGIYAILSGLIPPPVNFFPGNWLNSQTFTGFFGVPPWIFRSLIGLVIAVTIIRSLEVFDLETERRIEKLEQLQIIAAEQERLARDLHDGAIQKVYTAGLLVESASKLADPDSEVGHRLVKAVVALNEAVIDLRRNLAELHAGTRSSDETVYRLLEQIASDSRYKAMISISLRLNLDESRSLSPIRSGHLSAIVNEALSNVVRHAHAENVAISATNDGQDLKIVISDDGIGFTDDQKPGYGLRNIRDRARLLNGTIEFINNKGTTISLVIPWMD